MSVKKMFRVLAIGLALTAGSQVACALEDIPTTSGFSGVLGLSGIYTDAETNLVKGSSLWDIGQESVSSVTRSPKGEDDALIFPRGSFAYTFGAQQIQLFLASDVETLVDLEVLQQLGIRKQFQTLGIVSLGYVTSGLLSQEVWQDPYSAGPPRSDTDRDFTGVRFEWDRIAGLPIGFLFQYRDIKIDDEKSGQALGLSLQQQALLDREGDDYRAEVRYTWRKSANEMFMPYVGYVDADRDGDAVKYSGPYVGLDAVYRNETWGVTGGAKVGSNEKSKRNPVYGKRTDSDWYEIFVTGTYRLPWGNNWFARGGVAWAKENNKVAFQDQRNLLFSAGAEWRFGQK